LDGIIWVLLFDHIMRKYYCIQMFYIIRLFAYKSNKIADHYSPKCVLQFNSAYILNYAIQIPPSALHFY
jgi:hypothetical protein